MFVAQKQTDQISNVDAVGGDETVDTVLTLGNILRKYNPDIKGLSTGQGNVNSAGANLNVAVTGARIQGSMSFSRINLAFQPFV